MSENNKRKTAARKTVQPPKKQENNKKEQPMPEKKHGFFATNVVPYLLVLLGIAISFCLIFTEKSGFVGIKIVKPALCWLFGIGAATVPVLIFIQAYLWKKDIEKDMFFFKTVSALLIIICFSVIVHTIFTPKDVLIFANVGKTGMEGLEWKGGGFIGGFISWLFVAGIDKPLTLIVFIPMFLVFLTMFSGLTPKMVFKSVKQYLSEKKRRIKEYEDETKVWHGSKEKDKLNIDESALEEENERPKVDIDAFEGAMNDKRMEENRPEVDVALEDKPPFDPDVPLDELAEKVNSGEKEYVKPINAGQIDLDHIFYEDRPQEAVPEKANAIPEKASGDIDKAVPTSAELELMVERKQVGKELEKPAKPEPAPVKEYVFPPLSLLNFDNKSKDTDGTEEIRSTAIKLVKVLNSFKVKTRIVDVSRGPTITRYELAPEEGVRVRTIANLVDDISLNLATSGVRIEAPIPGKAAVGIEVPNKVVSTVYLREMLDSQMFRQAKSKVSVGLGMDVAGSPVFLDIAKMPHLLIAGATGMGKSVCINSMIVSLLYKATPDEVKLILIDPKKVELSIYAGLPHLLVPVVTEPKKAAGSLHWAVTEMDRRFELIEDVGVRDIASYNKATKDDPDREFLPQVVIVIDELADLMMTAPDDVEDSICRLAQKARAAGMHLVIGTQRPSVDVVTGLIKANIPSRIAFTMASQTDSRTIIDVGGAEKLIGRGDMLYAPVGASKLARVQGAFVSEDEIEKVVGYIKENYGLSAYDSEVIETIEKEAEKCGTGKKGLRGGDAELSGDDPDGDPLYKAAVELAIESGKISTSLLQRRLSVGYGRAAKLIDKMQEGGIVSAPEGQKPRSVLISRQEYNEMQFRQEDKKPEEKTNVRIRGY